MRRRLQWFFAGILVCCIFFSIPVLAAGGVTKTIKAVFNQVTVKIDGKSISGDKISYNGNVYVNAKSIADYLSKVYNVDNSGNVNISSKKTPTTTPSNTLKGKEVIFPDMDLDTTIRKLIKKPNGSIYESDLTKITEVAVYSPNNICNLEGIQYISNLKRIVLDSEGDLEDVSLLANLKELQSVTIENKKISDISPLASLKKIQVLSLDGNNIDNLNVIKNLTSLKVLRIANNKIKSLDGIENLVNLEQISFAGNSICDITPLKKLSKLKEYYKSSENLTIAENNKFYSLGFLPVLNSDNKNYFLDRYSSSYNKGFIFIDENNKIYSKDLGVITNLMNASKKQYQILESDNPFIDGVLNIKNYDYKNDSKPVYTSVDTRYQEGKIINKEGTIAYEYSLKPNEEKGVVKVGRDYLYSIDDIFKTFGVTYSIEFDKDKKLCGFKF